MSETAQASGPDLTKGVPVADVRAKGRLLGHVNEDPVMLVDLDGDIAAVGAQCTHYKGPLAEGLIVDGTVRCPWHHACFDLRTGEPVRAPALDPIVCWRVELRGDRAVVTEKKPAAPAQSPRAAGAAPESVLIVGGGAAGLAAADMLRREGYGGAITIISADHDAPCDRPNLSKDFLAGKAPDDWMPLRDADYYASQRIELLLGRSVRALDTRGRRVELDDGTPRPYGALVLATGAVPNTLDAPGAKSPHVHYLRSFADSRAIVAALGHATRVAVIGGSFIGLEVAASLRMRGLEVTVIAPDERPMAKILGPEAGDFIRGLHESQGVRFRLRERVARIDRATVTLQSGGTVDADLVVAGIGVRPATSWLEGSGIALDRGVSVNAFLETNVPGVFAAGDIARWPYAVTGEPIRVEHWVVAERQGQVAARNVLGRRERFDAVPFFWSQHYDTTINYVGHAERWDAIERSGDLASGDCTLTYRDRGRAVAYATIGRDGESLQHEAELERTHGVRS